MKISKFSGHIPVDDLGKTVLIGEGDQYEDDHEAVVARPELFDDVKPAPKRARAKDES